MKVVIYEIDSKNLMCIFAKSTLFLNAETNEYSVRNPFPAEPNVKRYFQMHFPE